ncbi:MAG: hypothetical protein DRZ76_01665 [Candidatus Nealsonbacteria bacterium]|nr:MAG: hypothetical protein DRZ76_01665 [Candidatus Nealsonbacteria bacterium]
MLEKFKNKKIVILGFGKEGRDTLRFLKKIFPKKKIDVADQKFDKNYLKKIKDYNIIIKSPGIPFKVVKPFTVKKQKVTSQTEIFFENCPGKIIGVTGTKGKSTTAFWIYQVLKNGGIKAHLVGNIGKPVLLSLLKAKKDDVFVYELSSFQLANLRKSPHIAVLLNIYPEHLDYYGNFAEYVEAKANIAKYQSKKDYLIYNCRDSKVKKIAKRSKARKIPIEGKYYELNQRAAEAVAKIFKVPTVKKFKMLPHRLELVGKFKGIEFYNDSLSTISETTIEALDFLGDNVQTLILGGFDRGLSFDGLAKRLIKSNVKTLILFPDTGRRIKQAIKKFQIPLLKFQYFFVKDMKKAVELAYRHTNKGKTCLLSPASPSFGIFKDYADRGNQFKKFIKMLK